jgi:hypothetical protein
MRFEILAGPPILCKVGFYGFFNLREKYQPLAHAIFSVEREVEDKVLTRPCDLLPELG